MQFSSATRAIRYDSSWISLWRFLVGLASARLVAGLGRLAGGLEQEAAGVEGVDQIALKRQRLAFELADQQVGHQRRPDDAARPEALHAPQAGLAGKIVQAGIGRCGGKVGHGADNWQA